MTNRRKVGVPGIGLLVAIGASHGYSSCGGDSESSTESSTGTSSAAGAGASAEGVGAASSATSTATGSGGDGSGGAASGGSDGLGRSSPVARWPILGGGWTPTGDEPFGSGGRLQARVHRADGGALAFQSFHDLDLDVDCNFELTEGGTRCVPSAPVFFTDSRCSASAAVHLDTGGCGDVEYVAARRDADEGCSGSRRTEVYLRGAAREVTGTVDLFRLHDGHCVSLGTHPTDVSGVLFDVEPVDPTVFAAATRVQQPLNDVLSREVLVADDDPDAFVAVSAFDRGRDMACRVDRPLRDPEDPDDSGLRCLPDRFAILGEQDGDYFANAGCTQRGAADPEGACEGAPALEVGIDDLACDAYYYDVSGPLVSGYVADPRGGSGGSGTQVNCAPIMDAGLSTFYQVLDISEPTSYPPLERLNVGGGRIQVRGVGAAGQWTAAPGRFFDTESDRECYPLLFGSGGELRCVPSWAAYPAAFADDACTIPLVEVQPDLCEVPAYGVLHEDGCGAGALEVRPIGAPWQQAPFRHDELGGCVASISDQDVYALGDPVDPGVFAQLTLGD